MRLEVIYHPDATADLIEAAQFYKRKVPKLGAHYLDAMDILLLILKTISLN